MNRTQAGFAGVVLACVVGTQASAQLFDLSLPASEDRWNYPFNGTPGTRFLASTFGATLIEGFDDHDAQFIVGFDTSSLVPTGQGAMRYHIVSARLTLTVFEDQTFRYDPTLDSYRTWLDPSDPEYAPDADPDARPVVVYGTGYRGVNPADGEAWSVSTWFETAPFGGTPVIEPAQGSRYAFVATVDANGQVVDVSNRLKERFDAVPLGVGEIPGVTPGDLVPADSKVVFDLSACAPGGAWFLREGLDAGVVRLSVGSLQSASGGPGGPTGAAIYPFFYTTENPLAPLVGGTPTLELVVRVGPVADLTGSSDPNDPSYGIPDGDADGEDFFFFLDAFTQGSAVADLTGSSDPNDPSFGQPDCDADGDDFFFFLDAFGDL
ncbi:MAG: GC-type dockerin domain-anchored protein [Phycisphaerales bacterium JB037]